MIFVTVGNAAQGFHRLLQAVDRLAGQGLFGGETVVMQAGNNYDFHSSYGKQLDFLPIDRFTALIHEAHLVISHAGAGTLIHVLQAGKVPIVMPRRRKCGEHIDDHQIDLVNVLVSESRIIPAYEPEDLPAAIAEARKRTSQTSLPAPSRMLNLVDQAIRELLGRRGREYEK